MINEEQLENLCLEWFRDGGWEVLRGPDIAPDGENPKRKDYAQVILNDDLQTAFECINPHLPSACFEQVLSAVTKPESFDLVSNNRAFHSLLLEGVPVEYKKEDETVKDHAFLIDFEDLTNNRFVAVNQFTITGTRQPRRPDIICFINGLPFAVLELKSPADENTDIWDAYNQLQTYKEEISDLFVCNEALIISDGYTARVGSLTATQERFLPWRTIKHEDDKPLLEWQLETMVRGFFDRELFLDYIRFFILFESDGETIIKKIAGYHQFHAVREAVKATVIAAQEVDNGVIEERRATYGDRVEPGSKKAGVVWHTQGSGKSISMTCYAAKLLQQPEMKNPTLVVVTDRNDLDSQLFETFSNATELLKQTPVKAENREELRQKLAERESGGIIFTTVQKFALLDEETSHPILNSRHNIVVISDEAHRSQYGLKAQLKEDGTYKFGYAKHLRDALPFASFIGFTGTPISQEDKDTRAVFGDYVSIYDIQDAVDDGATVPIYYESRLAKLDINHEEIAALSKQVEEVIEDEEDLSTREKTKGEWSRLEKLVGATPRLKQVAADLVEHFETRNEAIEGKAMVVAMSREIAVHLYNEIIALRPEWHDDDPEKGAVKIIMTGSASDKPLLQPHIYNKKTKKRLEKRFKDINDPLKMVIVRDMWLTGFDAPACHTMYVDKPMRGHNLMQAIARVNRVFKNKPGGLVVDYIGIANELKQALKNYTDSKGKGEPTLRAEEAYAVMVENLDAIRGMFAKTTQGEGLDISGYETEAHKLLVPAANYILGLEDGKKRYFDLVLKASKAYSLCSTLDEAQAYHKEIAFYSAIKAALAKFTSVDKKRSLEEKNSALKQILDNAVVAEGVADVFDLCGLEKPNIGLLSDEFLEDVRQMPYKNLAVELLEKLLKDDIHSKTRNNVVLEKRFADRLAETLRKYNNRAIETAQVIEELIQMAKEFQKEMSREDALGLNPDEIAFYDALANNESAVRKLGDEVLKKIAVEITEKLRSSTTVDWQIRDSVRARLRILVRRTLQRYKYPPDKAVEAVELVLKQAEALSASWSESPELMSMKRFDTFEKAEAFQEQEELLNDPRNVPVWFGTNRKIENETENEVRFNQEWSDKTTVGRCVVNVPKGHVPGSVGSSFWIRLIKGDDRLKILSINNIPEETYWEMLGEEMKQDRQDSQKNEALFFLHGYNVTFEDAAIRTAQLSYDLRIYPAVFFSWPSVGDVEDYTVDEATIEASYDSIIQFVQKLDMCALENGAVLHVMAHSMGNRAILRALEAIATGLNKEDKKTSIDKLVFAAPDVDTRVFMQALDKLSDFEKSKTLYVSNRDKAVWLSKVIHKYPRAGLTPPVVVSDGMDTIESSGVDDTFLGHSYFASVRALLTDLSGLLKSGLHPSERVGLEEEVNGEGKKYWKIL